jgi:ribokinase
VLLQLEVPLPAVLAAARAATGTVVLNPAPAPATPLPAELLAEVDVLVPNAGELEVLLAGAPPGPDPATRLGVPAVVTTLGPRGARVQPAGATAVDVPAPAVVPVDTTAAGDAFCGALADALCRGLGLEAAARWAVRVGAAATLTPGAQPSLPTPADVERLLP